MAFLYLLDALGLPRGSEIIFPALTFWVVPEIARVAGLTPVFADVDPVTFNLDPAAFERAITPRTRAVVPTHLYGLPCDMDAMLRIARRHGLLVIEDCAHALGATWQGRPVGTIGDAGFFSFQLLKPLNTYGGGMAVTNDARVAARLLERSRQEPPPSEARGAAPPAARAGAADRDPPSRLHRVALPRAAGRLVRAGDARTCISGRRSARSIRCPTAIAGATPTCRRRSGSKPCATSTPGPATPSRTPTRSTTRSAARQSTTPGVPAGCTHVFYQYAIYAAPRDRVVRRCLRRGIDVETLHVDVCTRLPLFGGAHAAAPGAEKAATAIQLPVYSSLSSEAVRRVAAVVREVVAAP